MNDFVNGSFQKISGLLLPAAMSTALSVELLNGSLP
jgi:hypothetical protein